MSNRLLQVEGHRGFPSKAQENTLEGFRVALEYGVPGIEFDIWLTADNVIVVAHGCDKQGLDKLWDPRKQQFVYFHLPSITFNELSELYALDKKSKICTLEEVVDSVGNSDNFYMNIELKHNSEKLVEEALKLLKRKNPVTKFEFCSFNHKLKEIVVFWCEQLHMPNVKFTYNINILSLVTDNALIDQITRDGDSISLDIAFVLMECQEVLWLIRAIKESGGVAKCYNYMTLTDTEDGDLYERLLGMEIDVFICNAPERLVEYNKQKVEI